jgi:hypothetical protein
MTTKNFLPILCLVASIAGCRQTNKTADIPLPVRFTNLRTLNKLLPNIISSPETSNEDALSDSTLQRMFPDTEIFIAEDGLICLNDSSSTCYDPLVVTKNIDGKHIFAIAGNNADTLLLFFRLHNGQWKEIGRRKPEIPVCLINLEELNGKPCEEIVAGTFPNMNGNSWKECFIYFPEEDTVRFAGSFCTDYTVDLKNRTLSEDYEGSHYMNPHKTLYVWRNDELIPLRKAVVTVPEDWDRNNIRTLEYYETDDYSQPLQLIFSETYDNKSRKHIKYWEHFFELKDKKTQ